MHVLLVASRYIYVAITAVSFLPVHVVAESGRTGGSGLGSLTRGRRLLIQPGTDRTPCVRYCACWRNQHESTQRSASGFQPNRSTCVSFDSLAEVATHLRGDPLSGTSLCLRNKCGDRLKLLYWDEDGYVIVYKRLEADARFPRSLDVPQRHYPRADLLMLLDGVDLATVRRSRHYRRWPPCSQPDISAAFLSFPLCNGTFFRHHVRTGYANGCPTSSPADLPRLDHLPDDPALKQMIGELLVTLDAQRDRERYNIT